MKKRHNKILIYIYEKREYIYLISAMLGTYIASTCFVQGTNSLAIYGDEYGYWQGAAFFLGIDWSETASANLYYGCGYGLFLAPIMKIWKNNSALMMQMAIRMQGLFLSSCVLVAYKCVGQLTLDLSCIKKIIVSVVVIFYPYNLLFVNLTMSECFLSWCIWILFFLYLKYSKEEQNYQLILIVLISIFMYLVHARTLSVLVATSVVLIYKLLNKKNRKDFFIFIVFSFIMLVLILIIKEKYIDKMYVKTSAEMLKVNNVEGQIDKIKTFMSIKGFINVIYSSCGKLYYILVGSSFFVGFGFLLCSKFIVLNVKNVLKCIPFIWLVLVFIFAWGISSLTMPDGFEYRMDILIYGRYVEYVCGPLMMAGVVYLLEKPKSKYLYFLLLLGLILSIIIEEKVSNIAPNSHTWFNCTSVARFFYIAENNKEAVFYITLSRSFLLFIIILSKNLNLKRYQIIVLGLLLIVGTNWYMQFREIWEKNVVEWRDDIYINQNEILNYIGNNAFALYEVEYPGFFQFLRVESDVYMFYSIEECIKNKKIKYFISNSDNEDIDWIKQHADIIKINDRYVLWNIK